MGLSLTSVPHKVTPAGGRHATDAWHATDAGHAADAEHGADAEYGAAAKHAANAQHAADAANDVATSASDVLFPFFSVQIGVLCKDYQFWYIYALVIEGIGLRPQV